MRSQGRLCAHWRRLLALQQDRAQSGRGHRARMPGQRAATRAARPGPNAWTYRVLRPDPIHSTVVLVELHICALFAISSYFRTRALRRGRRMPCAAAAGAVALTIDHCPLIEPG
eukprot:3544756-Prymnesium_polylepis.1